MKDPRIVALIDFQSVITEKYKLYRDHEAIPDRLELLQTRIKEAEKKLDDARKSITENQETIVRSKREKKKVEEKLSESQTKLNQVKTTREYESRQKEIKMQRGRLTELARTIEEGEDIESELEERALACEAELEEITSGLSAEIDHLEKESVTYEKELERIEELEQQKREVVPSEILERVDRLILLRGGLAVVPVNEGNCGGCGVQVSPQTIQVAKRGLDLIQCDRCSSYLYWDDNQD